MNSIQFLENKLKQLSERFQNANIRYEARESQAVHIIDITPLDFYQSEEYMYAEASLEDEFVSLFPEQTILFVSADSLTQVTDPRLILKCRTVMEIDINQIILNLLSPGNSNIPTEDYCGENNYALAA